MPSDPLRILLVEDDEDDFVLTRALLEQPGQLPFQLDWERDYRPALDTIRRGRHDLYLVDYRLGERTGLDLVRDAWMREPSAPVIILTGQDDYEVDLRATELGVTDYLVKGTLDGPSLERTIRYAIRHHRVMEDLRLSEERYAVAVRATNDAIWDWDLDDDLLHFSERWTTLLGYGAETFATRRPAAWFDLVHPDDAGQLQRELRHHLAGDDAHFEHEHRVRHADGDWRWVLARGLTTRGPDGGARRMTGSLSDVTDRRVAEQRLVHDALHDSLTGLPNRALFMDRLAQCVRHRDRHPGYGCALLYFDLDRFKLVNDSLSHSAGDRLLVELARRVDAVLRPGDTLARLGGDEFCVLLDGVGSPAEPKGVARRVAAAIGRPVRLERRDLSVTASIGIAHDLADAVEPEELVRNADIAMYAAKGEGGDRFRVFDASMHRRVVERVSLEAKLRRAIDAGSVGTAFQPIVDLADGRLRGLEVLARWPEGEDPVPPRDFIPVAEESGLIGPLGELVLRRACHTLADWRARGVVDDDVTVSVNVSIRQTDDAGFATVVREALAEAGLEPSGLVLEITESTLIENPERVRAVLAELLALGVGLQLDDFGTGYSSLTVLHDFPGDTLKIDRSFVATMLDRPESLTIVRAIVGLAHNLGLRVVGEGIETPEQRRALTDLGCEYGQGYHVGHPLDAGALETLLTRCAPRA
ncbi:MAG TPA: EAL domain-containing protein [Baekduia sp.]|uniref:putative bifunctional diguanylate cyclase/phosphodiesterase n=1 Tax=Baekduia sp. TaxID=2600305 RepID=UPI002D767405|nr:EAL domain-containing protein [Baekduia sp.]HET6508846.1 EAL domain-containing protein [Baekduia sp.]